VIRTVQDRGCLYLIDDRFTQPEVRALLPGWWQVERGLGPRSNLSRLEGWRGHGRPPMQLILWHCGVLLIAAMGRSYDYIEPVGATVLAVIGMHQL